jgi:hypothetical protein
MLSDTRSLLNGGVDLYTVIIPLDMFFNSFFEAFSLSGS